MTDSTYITEDETDESASITESEETIHSFTEDEIADLTTIIYEETDEYIKNNIINLSSPTFYTNLTEYVIYHVSELTRNSDDDDELIEFIEQTIEVYLQFCEVPMRSYKYSIDQQLDELNININIVEMLHRQITYLQSIPQPKQKTTEWHEFRYNMISASNLSKVFGSESQVNSLIYEKCKPLDLAYTNHMSCNTESPMHWGVKYEPVTVQIYEDMFQTKIGDFGCIPHPKYTFIGASPDGINIDPTNARFGRMLEIKNVVSREITGIPKEEYWIQTQIQMETCDLETCDFVETNFEEYKSADEFYEDTEREYKGVILHFIQRPTNALTNALLTNSFTQTSNIPVYIYMPLFVELTTESINDWIAQQKIEQKSNDLVLFSTIYWYLEEISCVLIPRNRQWFSAALPKIDAVWQTILRERVDGYEHRASKKRIQKINVTSDNASKSYVIKNMPPTNSICLIRMDCEGNVV
jgi:putative phage-type endonuclease